MKALILGNSRSPRMTALAKKLMKPSPTPYVFSKRSLCRARRSMMADMSTSLKVVRMAAVFWASFRLMAVRLRILLIGSRELPWASTSRDPAVAGGRGADLGAGEVGTAETAEAAGTDVGAAVAVA